MNQNDDETNPFHPGDAGRPLRHRHGPPTNTGTATTPLQLQLAPRCRAFPPSPKPSSSLASSTASSWPSTWTGSTTTAPCRTPSWSSRWAARRSRSSVHAPGEYEATLPEELKPGVTPVTVTLDVKGRDRPPCRRNRHPRGRARGSCRRRLDAVRGMGRGCAPGARSRCGVARKRASRRTVGGAA